MGLSWQQGPLSGASPGRFLTPEPLPQRLLFAEPLRRRLRVKLAGEWIADSEAVLLLHEPGRYPVAYFPLADVRPGVLVGEDRTTEHRDLGVTAWFTVVVGGRKAVRGAWQHTTLPDHAGLLRDRVAFAWRAMDAFFEEDERIVGHAADAYQLAPPAGQGRGEGDRGDPAAAGAVRVRVRAALVRAPRGRRPERADPRRGSDFCPYKGLCSYYDIGEHRRAAWSYLKAWPEVGRISGSVSFEPDQVAVFLDDQRLALEPGQTVIPHGVDRGLDPDEILGRPGQERPR